MIAKNQEKYVNVNSVIEYLKQQLEKYDNKYLDVKKEEYEIRKNFKASIHGDWRSAMKKKDKSLIYFGMCKSFKKTIKHLKISKEV